MRTTMRAALVSAVVTAVAMGTVLVTRDVTGTPAPPGALVRAAVTCVKPVGIAHRFGTERYPENTRQALRWATDTARARWLETDVQFDKVGTPFVIHDPTLDRTTNRTGPVAAQNLSALRAGGLRIDGGYLLPSWYEVLTDLQARPGVQMQAELKVRPTPAQLAKFLARLDWTGTRAQVVVTSFDPATLDLVKAAAPTLRRALIAELGWQDPAAITPHATTYSKHVWAITQARLVAWKAGGVTEVDAWTPDGPADWRRMASYGGLVTAVVTNKPNAYRLAGLC
jgi:glycerophosphoryl diester phosphodiesterase